MKHSESTKSNMSKVSKASKMSKVSKKPTDPARGVKAGPVERRSPCPIACALDLIGDRWTMLVVRDLMLGRTRFKEFRLSPEGIPTNILSERLERLIAAGVIEQRPVEAGGKRMAYALTESGSALRGVLMSMLDWGLKFIPGTAARMTESTAPAKTTTTQATIKRPRDRAKGS